MTISHISPNSIIEDVRRGDSEAFGQLVTLYQDRLFTAIVHVVRSPVEAEDIVQDAFVQAFVRLDSFRGESQFYTWLFRIAMNFAANRQRTRRHTVSLSAGGDDGDHFEPIDRQSGPEARLDGEEQRQRLQIALGQLPEPYRRILILRELEQFDYATIAQILGIGMGTVRSRLSRARAQLRERLSGEPRDADAEN